jgi:hypothetical protein
MPAMSLIRQIPARKADTTVTEQRQQPRHLNYRDITDQQHVIRLALMESSLSDEYRTALEQAQAALTRLAQFL